LAVAVLLLASLVCLTVGLFLTSTLWLTVSVVASVLAGLMIYRMPRRARRSGHARGRKASQRAAGPQVAPSSDEASHQVWVQDGRPRYHRQDCDIISGQESQSIPLGQAAQDGFIPCSLCAPEVLPAR
jgi:ABC-type nickel/cobalt efflux system permease component RcnA